MSEYLEVRIFGSPKV